MKSTKNKTKNKLTPKKIEVISINGPIKPDDQLILSTDELEEVHFNILLLNEPPKSSPRVVYDYKKKEFLAQIKKIKNINLISKKSTILYKESTEANIQIENELCRVPEDFDFSDKESIIERTEDERNGQSDDNETDSNIHEEEVNEEIPNEEDIIDNMNEIGEDTNESIKPKDITESVDFQGFSKEESVETFESLPITKICAVIRLKNKFNFFDRYIITEKVTQRDEETQTLTTKTVDILAYASQSRINDAYTKNYLKQQEELEKKKREKITLHLSKKNMQKVDENTDTKQNVIERNMLRVARLFEKSINLNTTGAIAQDFRFYEDPSDQFRGKEGTLLPLWTMTFDNANDLYVTDLSWSPDYFDLIGVTLGIPQGHLPFTESSDFGYVCLWSLKNSSYPEYVVRTHSGAICLDINRKLGYMLAVGLRDGHVAVYNASLPTSNEQYITDSIYTKHGASVRQVVWRKNLSFGELNFFSVSDDGTVCHWILMQSEIFKIVNIFLTIDMSPEIMMGGVTQTYYARGTTITFHPSNTELYSIGTVEGYIFKCNTACESFIKRFKAHQMSVNRIDYNTFNSEIYSTCSDDCTVKLWEEKSDVPLLTFDLQSSLTDVRWSPFSSTIFCAITVDCYVIFYNLDADLNHNVCKQLVQPADDYRFSRVALDKRVPLVVIGSSKSTVVTLKLSPNFRQIMKPPKKGVQLPTEILEQEKLTKVLESIKENVWSVPLDDDDDIDF